MSKDKVDMEDRPVVQRVKLSDLLPDDRNANQGTERGTYMLRRSIEKFGFAEAGTLDKNNRIVGGNKRTEASVDLGLSDDVIVIDVDGSTPVYIRRTDIDLSTPEGRELAIALNRTAQVSIEFDAEEIAREQIEGVDISDWFHENEIDDLIGGLGDVSPKPQEQYKPLAPFQSVHVLLSFPPDRLIDIQHLIEAIAEYDDVHIEQASN